MVTLEALQTADRMRPPQLIALKVKFAGNGLSTDEISRAQGIVGASFPDDLKLFLSHLEDPSGLLFDWKNVTKAQYDSKIERVLEGVLFDVKHNVYWHPSFGAKPENLEERVAIIKERFRSWPKLAPIYKHRFLPVEPLKSGNPVLSIWQTDIIAYGENLIDYLYNEFGLDSRMRPDYSNAPTTNIPVWYES